VKTTEITVTTGSRRGVFDISDECRRFAHEASGGGDGLLNVFVTHATAGLTVMELGAGSDADLMTALDSIFPRDDRWRHRHGSPGHGADHLVSMVARPDLTVPVVSGELGLGTWQSIALVDPNPDNATRRVRLSFITG
jgi:secondary thiamine-phosphate synthase enzyme